MRRDMNRESGLMQSARRLERLSRPLRHASAGYAVGQVAAPTQGESDDAAARAWERIRETGARAQDAAQRAANRMYDAAGRLYERWREARASEAAILSELRDGVAHFGHVVARAPESAARFFEGGGVVLLVLVGLALMGMGSSRS